MNIRPRHDAEPTAANPFLGQTRAGGPALLGAVLREPLVHFLALGAAIFALFAALDDSPPVAPRERIEITAAEAAGIVERFERTWRRPPTPAELSGLLDAAIEEEVLVREALALGLDRGDEIVRRRLAQKMRFLVEGAPEAEPTEAALAAHLEAHAERFARSATLTFEQVRLRPETGDADQAIAALNAGETSDAILGPGLLPPRMADATPAAVDGTFGAGFFQALVALPQGRWAGPVESGYGLHLVRLLARTPRRVPPLDEIREAVARDWREARRADLARKRVEALKARYELRRPDPAEVFE